MSSCCAADFRDGVSQLRERGLTYDLLLYPRHLPAAVKLVSEFPDQKFVLDHIAKPGIAAGLLAPWEQERARVGEVGQRVVQSLRDGHRGEVEGMEDRGFPAVPGYRVRGVFAGPADDRVRLAGLHCLSGLRGTQWGS